MAVSTTTTLARRRLPRAANTAARTGQDALASQAQRRAALEQAIAAGIAALDALDAAAVDIEPEPDECADDLEASAQRSTLAPDRHPARVIRFPARRAVLS